MSMHMPCKNMYVHACTMQLKPLLPKIEVSRMSLEKSSLKSWAGKEAENMIIFAVQTSELYLLKSR